MLDKGVLGSVRVGNVPGVLPPEGVLVVILAQGVLGVVLSEVVLVTMLAGMVLAYSPLKMCSSQSSLKRFLWCFLAGRTRLSSLLPLVNRLLSGVVYPDAIQRCRDC